MSLCCLCKGQMGNSRGQSIIHCNINTVFVLSNKLSFCCPRKNKTLFACLPAGKSDKTWCYFHTLTTCVHSTILSGNCEVLNSEVKRHFPLREIRFHFFLLLRQRFYPFHIENNLRLSSWTLFQRNIDVYIKQRRSLWTKNKMSCQHV